MVQGYLPVIPILCSLIYIYLYIYTSISGTIPEIVHELPTYKAKFFPSDSHPCHQTDRLAVLFERPCQHTLYLFRGQALPKERERDMAQSGLRRAASSPLSTFSLQIRKKMPAMPGTLVQ